MGHGAPNVDLRDLYRDALAFLREVALGNEIPRASLERLAFDASRLTITDAAARVLSEEPRFQIRRAIELAGLIVEQVGELSRQEQAEPESEANHG